MAEEMEEKSMTKYKNITEKVKWWRAEDGDLITLSKDGISISEFIYDTESNRRKIFLVDTGHALADLINLLHYRVTKIERPIPERKPGFYTKTGPWRGPIYRIEDGTIYVYACRTTVDSLPDGVKHLVFEDYE